MKNNFPVTKPNHLNKLLIFPISVLLCCSFIGRTVSINQYDVKRNLKDTFPVNELNTTLSGQLIAQNQQQKTAQVDILADSTSTRTDAEFPGGRDAWMHYLIRNFRYPKVALDKYIQGRVVVKFIVDEKGRLKNIDALTGPNELRQEAIRVIRESGRWIPAKENGKAVKSEKQQAVTFKYEFPEDIQRKSITDKIITSDTSVSHAVEIESSFPGGPGAWMRYLNRNFRYPEEAMRYGIQGTVVAQFIITKEGNISDLETVSGPIMGGLREEVIRIIRNSGKWIPATRNGQPLTSYKKQPITFSLQSY